MYIVLCFVVKLRFWDNTLISKSNTMMQYTRVWLWMKCHDEMLKLLLFSDNEVEGDQI